MKSSVPKAVSTTEAPTAIGPYSQAIRIGNWLYCSGQIPLEPSTGNLLNDSIEVQTEQVLKNLAGVLKSEGLSFKHVVKTTVFLTDLSVFQKMNEVYASVFQPPFPARSTVQVSALPKGAMVEIEAIAHIP